MTKQEVSRKLISDREFSMTDAPKIADSRRYLAIGSSSGRHEVAPFEHQFVKVC